MGLDARKPIFRVSDQIVLILLIYKDVLESQNFHVANLANILSRKEITKALITAGMRRLISTFFVRTYTLKSGFLTQRGPYYKPIKLTHITSTHHIIYRIITTLSSILTLVVSPARFRLVLTVTTKCHCWTSEK